VVPGPSDLQLQGSAGWAGVARPPRRGG